MSHIDYLIIVEINNNYLEREMVYKDFHIRVIFFFSINNILRVVRVMTIVHRESFQFYFVTLTVFWDKEQKKQCKI